MPSCLQVSLARQCKEGGRLKDACSVVKLFGLETEFPGLERQYQEHVVRRLLEKQLWPAAARMAGTDSAMQVRMCSGALKEDYVHYVCASQWHLSGQSHSAKTTSSHVAIPFMAHATPAQSVPLVSQSGYEFACVLPETLV